MSEENLAEPVVLPKWQEIFARIEQTGLDAPIFPKSKVTLWEQFKTYSWLGLIFSWVYYLYLGMYQRAAVLLTVDVVGVLLDHLWEVSSGNGRTPLLFTLFCQILVPLYCFRFTFRDYYLTKIKGQTFWTLPPSLSLFESSRNTWLLFAAVSVVSVVIIVITPGTDELLSDLDGVWELGNHVFIVNVEGHVKTITADGRKVVCGLHSTDITSGITSLTCNDKIVSLRKADTATGHFRLGMRVGDASSEALLNYVRPL